MAQRVIVTSITKRTWRSKRNTSITWFSFWIVRNSTLCFRRTNLTRKFWSRLIRLHIMFNLSFIRSFDFDTSRISYCSSMSIDIIKIIHRFMWNRTIYTIDSFLHKFLPFFILNNSPITFQLTENSVFQVHISYMIPWILRRSKTFTKAMSMLHKLWTFIRFIILWRCFSLLTLSPLHLNYLKLILLSSCNLLLNGLVRVTIWLLVFMKWWMLVVQVIRCDHLFYFTKFPHIWFFVDVHWFILFIFFNFWDLMTLMVFI